MCYAVRRGREASFRFLCMYSGESTLELSFPSGDGGRGDEEGYQNMAAKRKSGKKKAIVVLIVVLVLAAIGAGAYYLWSERGIGTSDAAAYVQSVAEITGQGGTMLAGRYSGVIEAKEIVKIKLDQDKTLDECFVAVGDKVVPGTPLFSYDVESLTLSCEQLKLDLEGKRNNIETMKGQVIDLEARIKKAYKTNKAELQLELNTLQLNLKKEEYEATKKQVEVDEAEKVINDNVIKAASAGTVRSITPPSDDMTGMSMGMGMGTGTDDAYITIVSGDEYRVKGTISEQTVYQLIVGTPVIIRSRIDEKQTWTGMIDNINTEEPVTDQNRYYYDNSGEQSSKYAFYVAIDSTEGLMMGQHVFIELDMGQEEQKASLMLPEFYLIVEGDRHYVYAASEQNRIEKRQVTVGAYDPELGAYEITDGLTLEDRIAFPDETVSPGMTAADAGYADGNGGDGASADGGMDMGMSMPAAVPIG